MRGGAVQGRHLGIQAIVGVRRGGRILRKEERARAIKNKWTRM